MAIGTRCEERIEIYALTDPDGSIRYIGKAKNSQARLKSHLLDMLRRDTPVYRWMRKLANAGLKPTVIVLIENSECWQEGCLW